MTIYVNDTEVYMGAGEIPGFTYSLWSLAEPDRVPGSRSTTFKVPVTNSLVKALGPWHMGYVPDADLPTIRIVQGTAILYEGRVVVTRRAMGMYEMVAVGGNGGWVEKAKNTQLNEIEMGETQVITRSYIVSRWSDTSAADAYPVIDYGSFASRASSYDVPLAKVRPHPRVHRVLKAFFNANGYTVEARGSFGTFWEKLVIAPGTGRIQVEDSYLTGNTMVTRTTAGTVLTVSSGAVDQVIPAGFVSSDPGSNYTATYRYTAPYAMRIKGSVTGTLRADFVNSVAPRWGEVQLYNVTANTNTVGRFNLPTTSAPFTDFDFAAETFELEVAQNDVLEMRILLGSSGNNAIASATLQDAGVTFIPTNIEYQANIAVQIGKLLPRAKVSDLIKALTNIQNLVVVTDDREHRVELWRMDDWLKSPASGVDWSDRLHFGDGFARLQDDIPSRVEFRMEEDEDDVLAAQYRQENDLGLGDANSDNSGGWVDPYEVSVKFASTQTAQTFDGLTIPTIWNDRADFQEDDYEHVPRILITDGLAPGAWTFSGSGETEYPVTYLAGPSGTMSFGEVGGYPGTVTTLWAQRLRWMSDGRVLDADLMIHDNDPLDFSRPVFIDYGDGRGWFYLVEIDRKRYGVHEPTPCKLIPLV